jgi:hypothetical protein
VARHRGSAGAKGGAGTAREAGDSIPRAPVAARPEPLSRRALTSRVLKFCDRVA